MPWESIMSNAAAHLASASSSIEQLAAHCGRTGGPMVSMELASQSVWTAMVSLEECSFDLWTPHEPTVLVRGNTNRRSNTNGATLVQSLGPPTAPAPARSPGTPGKVV
jgi:hypothetical protein